MCFPGVFRSNLCQCGWRKPTCCRGGKEGGMISPAASCMCALNAAIPTLHSSPPSHQWPNAAVQEKAQQEGCDSMAFPGLARWGMWWGKVHCCGTPALTPPSRTQPHSLPPLQPWKAAGWAGKGGRQLLLLPSHPAQTQGPAALRHTCGHGRAAVVCMGTMGATIVPAGHSQVPDSGRREGDFFK